MKNRHRLITNPSVLAAAITAAVSLIIALLSCFWALYSDKVTLQLENDRLIGFHKLEIFENAIAEINYLVPLYSRLSNDAFEKRTESEIKPVLSLLRQEINAIIEYQKQHNAIEKAKIYSSSLANCIPFAANQACVNYMCKLDSIEQNGRFNPKFSMDGDDGVSVDMYLVDALSEYKLCVEQLKKEIENLEWFRR